MGKQLQLEFDVEICETIELIIKEDNIYDRFPREHYYKYTPTLYPNLFKVERKCSNGPSQRFLLEKIGEEEIIEMDPFHEYQPSYYMRPTFKTISKY